MSKHRKLANEVSDIRVRRTLFSEGLNPFHSLATRPPISLIFMCRMSPDATLELKKKLYALRGCLTSLSS